jgi:hypothetical protein
MCSVRQHASALERNATLHTICWMSSSQPLTISDMFGFCKFVAACWSICWSILARWRYFQGSKRGGRRPAIWPGVGLRFAWTFRFGPRRCAQLALAYRFASGRPGTGPANVPRWWYAPIWFSSSGHFGPASPPRQAAGGVLGWNRLET